MAENLFRQYAREAMDFLDAATSPAEQAAVAGIICIFAFASLVEERKKLERTAGIEPATTSLATRHSTSELRPRRLVDTP
jgi:hypothetical protein